LHWRDRARTGRAHLPAGSTVWLPEGTKRRVASHPPPVPTTMVARNESKASSSLASQAVAKVDRSKATATAKASAKTTTKVSTKAQAKPATKAASAAKYHVVKPQETLYRVAMQNGISVDELRRLNKMRPDDNNIRPGQKLKVST
jgi:membrane-bound lytic murein transglycosylase D